MRRILAIMTVAGLVLSACGGDAAAPSSTTGPLASATSLSTPDGTAVLHIPAGALPLGVSAASVTLTEVTAEPDMEDANGGPLLAAFVIEPSGTVLLQPATLTFPTLAFEEPVAWLHLSGEDYENVEVVGDDAVTLDESARTATVEISHFSMLTELPAAFYDVTVEHDIEYLVGDTVRATVSVVRSDYVWTHSIMGGRSVLTFSAHDEWTMRGSVLGYGSVTPPYVSERPPSGTAVSGLFQDVVEFTCNEPGEFDIAHSVAVTSTYHGTQSVAGYPSEEWDTGATTTREYRGNLAGECLAVAASGFTPGATGRTVGLDLDDIDDLVDSIIENLATFVEPWIDQIGSGSVVVPIDGLKAAEWFNESLYECGQASDEGQTVVCPPDVADVPEGELLIGVAQMAADIPLADPDHSYIYAMVFESNGDPSDDWVFFPPFEWDFYQGADRWYELIWDHRQGSWTVWVSQLDATRTPLEAVSSARVLIDGDRVIWLISMSEFASAVPSYRISSFGHDGAYSESDRGGDVNGANPTEPLTPVTGT